MEERCVNHPDHGAIEHCEVCGRALCGLCLWYGDDGHRLCEDHAHERETMGETVHSPDTYAEAIPTSLSIKDGDSPSAANAIPYRGNSTDLNALVGAVMAVTTLASCMGGAYCLPIGAAALGLIAYTNAHKAVDPKRTRNLAAVSLAIGALMLLFVFAYIAFFVFFIAFAFLTSAAGP